MRKVLAAVITISFFCSAGAFAEAPIPTLAGHVIDVTATLTATQQAALEQKLTAFEAKKGSQIVVLIVPTTNPEAIEQYSLRVAEQWKIGRKKIDDGAILLIAKNDRALRIEVGYGLEGALTDATSKRIIAEIITPYFKQGDFNSGISAGVNQIMQVLDGEPLPEPIRRSNAETSGSKSVQSLFPIILVIALVVGSFLRGILGRFAGSLVTGGVIAVVAWFFAGVVSIALIAGVIALLFTLFGGGGGGMMGRGGGFGGGFGGGLGGGGFSGGGGGFGGGGASGRW